jgi:hypothetical protein
MLENHIREADVDILFLKPAFSSSYKFLLSRNHISLVDIIFSNTFVRIEVRVISQHDYISSAGFPGFNVGMIMN